MIANHPPRPVANQRILIGPNTFTWISSENPPAPSAAVGVGLATGGTKHLVTLADCRRDTANGGRAR